MKRRDVWLTPREAAEHILGHAEYKRSGREIYNMQKKIQRACRVHRSKDGSKEYVDYFGLVCPPPLPNGHLRIKLSEVERWAKRHHLNGLVEAANG